MNATKKWWQSKTIWLNVAAIIAIGTQVELSQMNETVNLVFALVANIAGIWARYVAQAKIG